MAFVLASKCFDDLFFENSSYAKMGGISPKELLFLEKQFLALLDYEVFVSAEDFSSVDDRLSLMASQMGLSSQPDCPCTGCKEERGEGRTSAV